MKVFLYSNIRFLIFFAIVLLYILITLFFGDFGSIIAYLQNNAFFLSAFASFCSALVLAMIVFIMFRPRVAISPVIARRTDPDTNIEYFSFKFINTSIFSAFEVNVEAYVCYETSATNNGKGMNVRTKKVDLRRSNWIYMSNWRYVKQNTTHAPHCMIVSTKLEVKDKENYVEDIEKEIEANSNYLEFRVTLKHSFSNLSSTYRKRFNTAGCVEAGKYKFGNSLEIV